MTTALVAATGLSILFAIVMTAMATRLRRETRARSAARVAALQAAVAGPPDSAALEETPDTWDLEFAELRTPNSELRTSSSHPLFEESAQRMSPRPWPWAMAAGLVMAFVVGGFYVVSSGVIGRTLAANAANASAAKASPIELLSLRHSTDTPDTFTVVGLVQNPGTSAALRGVFAVVYLFDAEGRYLANSRSPLESAVLSPGGEAPFVVRVPSSLPGVSRYRVSFQHEDGTAVIHVDRRGTMPVGTTGDAVDTKPPATPLVTARKTG